MGDPLAVIPSFLDDGIAKALAGGMMAGASILRGGPALASHAAWRGRLAPPMRIAAVAEFVLRRAPGVARQVLQRTRVADAGQCMVSRDSSLTS